MEILKQVQHDGLQVQYDDSFADAKGVLMNLFQDLADGGTETSSV
jgi:hypothetical protein